MDKKTYVYNTTTRRWVIVNGKSANDYLAMLNIKLSDEVWFEKMSCCGCGHHFAPHTKHGQLHKDDVPIPECVVFTKKVSFCKRCKKHEGVAQEGKCVAYLFWFFMENISLLKEDTSRDVAVDMVLSSFTKERRQQAIDMLLSLFKTKERVERGDIPMVPLLGNGGPEGKYINLRTMDGESVLVVLGFIIKLVSGAVRLINTRLKHCFPINMNICYLY